MSETILVVDYDPRSIHRIANLLGSLGLHAELALDGITAFASFARLLPALTLVQDLLPRRHGFELCRAIKDTPEGRCRPVVLLTAKGRHGALIKTGCDAYLAKPFDDEALEAIVRHFLPPQLSSRRSPAAG